MSEAAEARRRPRKPAGREGASRRGPAVGGAPTDAPAGEKARVASGRGRGRGKGRSERGSGRGTQPQVLSQQENGQSRLGPPREASSGPERAGGSGGRDGGGGSRTRLSRKASVSTVGSGKSNNGPNVQSGSAPKQPRAAWEHRGQGTGSKEEAQFSTKPSTNASKGKQQFAPHRVAPPQQQEQEQKPKRYSALGNEIGVSPATDEAAHVQTHAGSSTRSKRGVGQENSAAGHKSRAKSAAPAAIYPAPSSEHDAKADRHHVRSTRAIQPKAAESHHVGAATRAIAKLEADLAALQRENEELKGQNLEVSTKLRAEQEVSRKKGEDLATVDKVLTTVTNIRADLEKQRDQYYTKWQRAEMEKKALLASSAAAATKSPDSPAATRTGSDVHELEAKVADLERQLAAKIDDLATAQREISIKAIDLELKDAQEAYLKVRLDNMEAELALRKARVDELEGLVEAAQAEAMRSSEFAAAAQAQSQQHQLMLHQFYQRQQDQAQDEQRVGGSKIYLDLETRHSAAESQDEEHKMSGPYVGHDVVGAPGRLRAAEDKVDPEERGGEDEASEEGVEGGVFVEDGEPTSATSAASSPDDARSIAEERESESEASGGEPAWLFSISPSERAEFVQLMDFAQDQVRVLEHCEGGLGAFLVDLQEEFAPDLAATGRALMAGTTAERSFWAAAREVLARVCCNDVLFVIVSSPEDDPATQKTIAKLVAFLADAYDGCEVPGKVVLALEGVADPQIVSEDPAGDAGSTVVHDVIAFRAWMEDCPAEGAH